MEGYRKVPADYAIDALVLEADRRSKALGRPYSYGQLVADTTREEREKIAEEYKQALKKALKKGRHRVGGGTKLREYTHEEIFREFRQVHKMEMSGD